MSGSGLVVLSIAGPGIAFLAVLAAAIRTLRVEPHEMLVLRRSRDAIVNLGLFSTVRFELDNTADANGMVGVTLHLAERKHRSIRAGIGYSTDEGPRVDPPRRRRRDDPAGARPPATRRRPRPRGVEDREG